MKFSAGERACRDGYQSCMNKQEASDDLICVRDLDDCPITAISLVKPSDDQDSKFKPAIHVGDNNLIKDWIPEGDKTLWSKEMQDKAIR